MRWIVPGLLLVVALCSALAWFNNYILLSADSVPYMVLGRALAQGAGYRLISSPEAPIMRLYPPGYPALLAVVLALTGFAGEGRVLLDAVLPCKIVNLLFFLASVVVLWNIATRRLSRVGAMLVVLLFSLSPAILSYTMQISAEIPLAFFCLVTIEALDRAMHGERKWFWIAGLGIVGGFYMRTAGLALWAALIVWLCGRRRWVEVLKYGSISGLFLLPWFIHKFTGSSVGVPIEKNYFAQLLALDPYGSELISLHDLWERFWYNLKRYVGSILPQALYPFLSRAFAGHDKASEAVIGSIACIPVVAGYFVSWRRKPGVLELFVPAFAITFLLWPWVLGIRLALPFLPFLILYLVMGLEWAINRLGIRRLNRPVAPALLVVCCVPILLSSLRVTVSNELGNLRGGMIRTLESYYRNQPQWLSYLEAVNWLNSAVPDNRQVVMGRNAPIIYFLTGRRAVEYPYSSRPADLQAVIARNRVRYVIEDQFRWTHSTEIFLVPAMRGLPDGFDLVYETAEPATRVWAVRPSLWEQ